MSHAAAAMKIFDPLGGVASHAENDALEDLAQLFEVLFKVLAVGEG